MNKIVIDYKKRCGNNGTVYDQMATIDKNTMEEYNQFLNDLKTEIDLNFMKTHIYSENDLKIKSIDFLEKGVNFTNLIHLNLFIVFCQKTKRDITRLLYRNTIIKVVE